MQELLLNINGFLDGIILPASFHMWAVLVIAVATIYLFASEKLSMELTSLIIIGMLLLFFKFFPYYNVDGYKLSLEKLLMGFANPALIGVLCLLVLGQTVVQTGVLDRVSENVVKLTGGNGTLSLIIILIFVGLVSGFMNNTPVVVIFIPIMVSLAKNLDISVSKVMIPLSYASILGGMMTLIGSSTNLLVSGILHDLGLPELSFFEFTKPGAVLAFVGIIYILVVLPRILPDRADLASDFIDGSNRMFAAQLTITHSSKLVGTDISSGYMEDEKIRIKMVQRGNHAFLPPYDNDFTLKPNDLLVAVATKGNLMDFFKDNNDLIDVHLDNMKRETDVSQHDIISDLHMAEVVITPNSSLVGKTLSSVSFFDKFKCMVLGIQRNASTIRTRITSQLIKAGDVMLLMGKREEILQLQQSNDFIMLDFTTQDIYIDKKARIAGLIFAFVVGSAALGIMPITISAFIGVIAVIATDCINIRQSMNALDSKIFLMIPASIALGIAMQETGGARFLADGLVGVLDGLNPLVIMSVLFIFMAGMTNILSNNAAAVLFTPIAVNIAGALNVDPMMFIFAVIFACNCSFITPIGYQTNLMVMNPGQYKFADFIKSGAPLAVILWITYCVYAYFVF